MHADLIARLRAAAANPTLGVDLAAELMAAAADALANPAPVHIVYDAGGEAVVFADPLDAARFADDHNLDDPFPYPVTARTPAKAGT